MREFLSVEQLAGMFGLSRSWVYKIVLRGEITSYKVGGRVFFKQEDIEQFIERQRVECQYTNVKTKGGNIDSGSGTSKRGR